MLALFSIVVLTLAAQVPRADQDSREERMALAGDRAVESRVATAAGDLARGREFAQEGIEAILELEPDDAWAVLLERLGTHASEAGDEAGGAVALERALAFGREHRAPEDLWLLHGLGNLAQAYKSIGRADEALALERELLETFERSLPASAVEHAMARLNLSKTCALLGRHERGFEYLAEAEYLVTEHRAGDPVLLEMIWNNMASAQLRRGAAREARELMERVLESREGRLPEDHPALLRSRGNLASALQGQGFLQRSRELTEQLVLAYERLYPPDHHEALWLRMRLASLAQAAGDLPAARALLEGVIAAREELAGDEPALLMSLERLALVAQLEGHLQEARDLGERVLAGREARFGPGHPDVVAARSVLASLLLAAGDAEGSLVLWRRVAEERRATLSVGSWRREATNLGVADALFALGRQREALAIREATLPRLEQILAPGHSELLSARQDLATNLLVLGEVEQATGQLRELERQVRETYPEDHPSALNARLNLARALDAVGEREAAIDLLTAVQESAARARPAGDLRRRAASHGRALLLAKAGRVEEARAETLRTVDELEAWLDHGARVSAREARAAAAGVSGRLSLVLSVAGEGESLVRAFEAVEMVRRASFRPLPPARDEESFELRAQLQLLAARLAERGSPGSAGETDVAELALERDRVERRLWALQDESGAETSRIRLQRVAGALPPGVAVAAFLRYQHQGPGAEPGSWLVSDRVLVHVVRSDGTLRRIELGSAGELEALVADWRGALGRPVVARGVAPAEAASDDPARLEELGRLLSARLVDPVLAAAGDVHELRLALDDFLHLVPFDALPRGEGMVGDELGVRLVPDLAWRPAPRAPREAAAGECLVIGDVLYGEPAADSGTASFAPLPGTAEEVYAVSAFHADDSGRQALVLLGAEATKSALVELAGRARWLHVATHGWFSPADAGDERATFAPLTLCGLALAGANEGRDRTGRLAGILSAEELAGLDLAGCELAVLSACETNVGVRRAGQGIQSLQAALHTAGARTAVTSLWRVEDEAARVWMERFYESLWRDGLAPLQALERAKSELRAEGRPVRDWAGWVLSGWLE